MPPIKTGLIKGSRHIGLTLGQKIIPCEKADFMIIGYEGYSPGNSGIADRRRILFWAAARNHSIVDSRDPRSDVIIITSSADLGYWAKVKTTKPIILDVVDGLIGEQSWSRDLLRGYGYWGTRRSSNFLPKSYRNLILQVAQRSSAVICSSPEQVLEWKKFHIDALDILDIHDEIPKIDRISDIRNLIPNQIFWEGLPATLNSMALLNEFFDSNLDKEYTLNILTNLSGFRYMNRYRKVNLEKVLSDQISHENLKVNKVQWSPGDVVKYSRLSKLGVIPIVGYQGYNHLKAENRLLIMWRLGLPVLTSPLMSYSRVMRVAQIDGICQDATEWKAKMGNLFSSADLREEFIQKSQSFLEANHKTSDLLGKWDFVVGKS